VENHSNPVNIRQLVNSSRITDGSFAAAVKKYVNCKLCVSSWPLTLNIQADALHLQVVHLRHILENHSNAININ